MASLRERTRPQFELHKIPRFQPTALPGPTGTLGLERTPEPPLILNPWILQEGRDPDDRPRMLHRAEGPLGSALDAPPVPKPPGSSLNVFFCSLLGPAPVPKPPFLGFRCAGRGSCCHNLPAQPHAAQSRSTLLLINNYL